MRALYLDSSAFVKVLVAEPESGALRELLSRRPDLLGLQTTSPE